MRSPLKLAISPGILMVCLALSAANAKGAQPATREDPGAADIRTRAEAIDATVESFFAKFNVPVPPPADDAVFLRRAYLGITGQIPSAKEAGDFFADANPNKRAALINRLIDSPEASDQLFQHFADMLHLQDEALGASQRPFLDWLRRCLQNNEKYDTLVRGMMTAEGSLEENPAVGWLLGGEGSVMPATMDLCNVWLGYNTSCTTCHDSPYSEATQMEFYQIAANFSALRTVQKTPNGEEHFIGKSLPLQPAAELAVREDRLLRLRLPRDYAYRDGQPGEVVVPRLPRLNRTGRNSIWRPAPPPWPFKDKPPLPAPKNMREMLAQWVTIDNEARFSHRIAVRLWTHMLGECTDTFALNNEDLRHPLPMPGLNAMMPMLKEGTAGSGGSSCHSGPTSHYGMRATGTFSFSLDADDLENPVLSVLAAVMRNASYDLREYQRVIWNTRTAQREATPDAYGVVSLSKFTTPGGMLSSPLMRRMRAEQIWDALVSLAGSNTTEKPSRDLPLVLEENHPLRVLGRSARSWSDGDRAPLSPTIARWMMHSPLVLAVAAPGSRVMDEMHAAGNPDARIRHAFLSILSRPPTPGELERARSLYGSTEMDTPAADSFLVWALLNTSEFLFLH